MNRPSQEKFRRHILKINEQEGLSLAKVAKPFGIGKQTMYHWTNPFLEKKVERFASKAASENAGKGPRKIP